MAAKKKESIVVRHVGMKLPNGLDNAQSVIHGIK